jgi:DNA-binding MarR family transcriptional regulator
MMSRTAKGTAGLHPPADPVAQCLMACPDFILSSVAVTVTEALEKGLEPLGIRLKHYRLLRVLLFEGPQPQNSLAAMLQVDRTTVVALIDYLEARKLAKRERSPQDRRAYEVRLTAKGETVARKATTIATLIEEKMFAPLDKQERAVLRLLSTRILGLS